MSAYLDLLPSVLHDVGCSNETHQLAWSHGAVTALDHADPEGERMLTALGGARSRCIDVLDAWQRQKHSLRVLTLAPRGNGDVLVGGHTPPGAQPGPSSTRPSRGSSRGLRIVSSSAYSASVHFGWASTGYGTQPPPENAGSRDDIDLLTLLGLGNGLPHRLVAGVLDHWSERVDQLPPDDPDLPALAAALYGRATAAVSSWLGSTSVPVDVRMASGSPSLTTSRDGVALTLPFHWLSRVWATGFAVTANRFVLDATLDDGGVRLQTVGPDGGDPTPMTVRLG